jgi:protein-disulfide isomerase
MTRRAFTAALSVTGLAALFGAFKLPLITEASAQSATTAALATPSPLGDMALGPADAAVTVVEYASMTCPHCAAFSVNVFPKVKSAYIDTGKIRFIFREFPLDVKAAAGSMIARCVAKDDSQKYFAVVETLFQQQADWAGANTVDSLKRIGRQAGMSEQGFDSCLSNQEVLDGIKKVQEIAGDQLKVNSTPSFFINGKLVTGEQSFEEFSKLIDPLLKS